MYKDLEDLMKTSIRGMPKSSHNFNVHETIAKMRNLERANQTHWDIYDAAAEYGFKHISKNGRQKGGYKKKGGNWHEVVV